MVGREGLLSELDIRLASSSERSGPQTVALCGLGGAGKTSVAVEYAHRRLANVGLCWQFSAEDPEILKAEFAVLAAQLGVRDEADSRDPVASVHAVLARTGAEWLLLFDNARDWPSVESFIPPAGPGQVLVTTQSQHWPSGQSLEVPILSAEVAADFLVDRTGDPDPAAARELATELGGLPLALEQAGAYMQATSTPLARYLPLFRTRQADLLSRGEAPRHPADVATTLGLALTRLEEAAPAAAGLLRVLAFMAPEPIPLSLLLAEMPSANDLSPEVAALIGPLIGDVVTSGDAISALRRYSLVTPAGDGRVLVHRLVQAITRTQLPPAAGAQWKNAAASLIEAAVPENPKMREAWSKYAALLPHGRTALGLTSKGLLRIAVYLSCVRGIQGRWELLWLIIDAHKDRWEREPDNLADRHHLVYWTELAGDTARARDQYADLRAASERLLGPQHPDTLKVRLRLAVATGDDGDAAEAHAMLADLLADARAVFGPEHPDTLHIHERFAYWTGRAGDYAGARDHYADLKAATERLLGPDHPDTLAARKGLASWTGSAGDRAGARDRYADLRTDTERLLGLQHPDTLTARHRHAVATGNAGDAAAAHALLADLLADARAIFGPEHPDTLNIHESFAYWTAKAGDPARATDEYNLLLPISRRVLGPGHTLTSVIKHNRGWFAMFRDPSRLQPRCGTQPSSRTTTANRERRPPRQPNQAQDHDLWLEY
jgi:hypothetical protein